MRRWGLLFQNSPNGIIKQCNNSLELVPAVEGWSCSGCAGKSCSITDSWIKRLNRTWVTANISGCWKVAGGTECAPNTPPHSLRSGWKLGHLTCVEGIWLPKSILWEEVALLWLVVQTHVSKAGECCLWLFCTSANEITCTSESSGNVVGLVCLFGLFWFLFCFAGFLFVFTYMEIQKSLVQWSCKGRCYSIKLLCPLEKPLLAGGSCVQKLSRIRQSGDFALPNTLDISAELLQRTWILI